MNQQELLKRAQEFLDRTDIKGSEAEDMAMVKSWLKQLQSASLAAAFATRAAPTVPVAGATQVADAVGK